MNRYKSIFVGLTIAVVSFSAFSSPQTKESPVFTMHLDNKNVYAEVDSDKKLAYFEYNAKPEQFKLKTAQRKSSDLHESYAFNKSFYKSDSDNLTTIFIIENDNNDTNSTKAIDSNVTDKEALDIQKNTNFVYLPYGKKLSSFSFLTTKDKKIIPKITYINAKKNDIAETYSVIRYDLKTSDWNKQPNVMIVERIK